MQGVLIFAGVLTLLIALIALARYRRVIARWMKAAAEAGTTDRPVMTIPRAHLGQEQSAIPLLSIDAAKRPSRASPFRSEAIAGAASRLSPSGVCLHRRRLGVRLGLRRPLPAALGYRDHLACNDPAGSCLGVAGRHCARPAVVAGSSAAGTPLDRLPRYPNRVVHPQRVQRGATGSVRSMGSDNIAIRAAVVRFRVQRRTDAVAAPVPQSTRAGNRPRPVDPHDHRRIGGVAAMVGFSTYAGLTVKH